MESYSEILVRCEKHDRRAQMAFYDRFYQDVYRSAFYLLGETGEAEEVMQEVLLKALDRISEADRNERIMRNRLKRMAINASIDLLRKRKTIFQPIDEHADFQEEYVDVADQEWRVERLKQAVDTLPIGYRTVVNLRLLEEFSFDEIAELLGISSSTARSQFTRAKQRLIWFMKENENGNR